jgi:hypothetical protein
LDDGVANAPRVVRRLGVNAAIFPGAAQASANSGSLLNSRLTNWHDVGAKKSAKKNAP